MSGAVIKRKKRQPPLSVRLNAGEREALEAKAGALPLSSYIKSVVLDDDAPKYRANRKPPVEDQRLLAELLARLGNSRLASNLNQIAKSAHLGALPVDPELERELAQACLDVAWMRVCLIEALGLRSDRKGDASAIEAKPAPIQQKTEPARPSATAPFNAVVTSPSAKKRFGL